MTAKSFRVLVNLSLERYVGDKVADDLDIDIIQSTDTRQICYGKYMAPDVIHEIIVICITMH